MARRNRLKRPGGGYETIKYAESLSSGKVEPNIKSYVIGNAICGTHNVAFVRRYAAVYAQYIRVMYQERDKGVCADR